MKEQRKRVRMVQNGSGRMFFLKRKKREKKKEKQKDRREKRIGGMGEKEKSYKTCGKRRGHLLNFESLHSANLSSLSLYIPPAYRPWKQ